MVNTRAKGDNLQKKAADILRDLGYTVDVTTRMSSFRNGRRTNIGHDFFGAFDIIAFLPGCGNVRWIQVTTLGHVSHKKRVIEDLNMNTETSDLEIWGWKGGKDKIDKRSGELIPARYFKKFKLITCGDGTLSWKSL